MKKTYRYAGKTYGTLPPSKTPTHEVFELGNFKYSSGEFDGWTHRIRFDMYKFNDDLPYLAIMYTNNPDKENIRKSLMTHAKNRVRELEIQHFKAKEDFWD